MSFLSIDNFKTIKNTLIKKYSLSGNHYNIIHNFMKEINKKYKNEELSIKNKIVEMLIIDYIKTYFRKDINININNEKKDYDIKSIIKKNDIDNKEPINYQFNKIIGIKDSSKIIPGPNKELIETVKNIKSINDIKEEYVLIDSRDRNFNNYSENNYKILLNKKYKNVIDIEFINAIVPNSQTLIHNNNNKLYFKESNNETLTATLTNGNYTTISSLATEIQTQLNIVGSSTYTVSEDDNKRITNLDDIDSVINTSGFNSTDALFDGDTTTHWTKSSSSTGQFIIKLKETRTINEYEILCYLSDGFPSDWTVDVSIDGNTWINIDTQSSQLLTQFIPTSYSLVSNYFSAKYIRFNITGINSGTDLHITNIEFKERSDNTITITSDLIGGDGIFSLLFDGFNDTPYKILGFNPEDYTSYNNYTSEKDISFTRDNYVYIYINSFDSNKNNPNNFFQLLLDSEYGDFTYYANKNNKDKTVKFQNLDTMDILNISFRTYDGNLYEFNGLEHSMLLKIRYLNIYYNLPSL